MIPEERVSDPAVIGQTVGSFFLGPLKAIEWGGVALNDASQGINVKPWMIEYKLQTGDVVVSAPDVAETILFNRDGISQVSLAFDRNMQPVVAFVQLGQAKLYWFDPIEGDFVFWETELGAAKTPRVTHDDKRDGQSGISDVILGYVVGSSLRYRQQRDRYEIERTLLASGVRNLIHIGMNDHMRLQFSYGGDGSGVGGTSSPVYLAEVVADLCRQAGRTAESIDVSELYSDVVPGLKVQTDEGLVNPINWLRDVFFFDNVEYDRVVHFVKRGREVVAWIPYSDLVFNGPTTLKQTTQDEAKLPRIVNVNHIDPAAGYAKNKQTATRRSNTINAKGKHTIESQVVLSVDQAATAALTKLKVFWNELITYEFATTIKWTELTPTDVVMVEDAKGQWHRMRLEERNEDGPVIEWQGKQDAGVRTYGSAAAGNNTPPPTSTTPGVIGETQIEILNIAIQRDQDDELGLYIAAAGSTSAWTGYQMLISTDGGVTYSIAYETNVPSTIGETMTDLEEDEGYEYQSHQNVEVFCNFALSSVSYDQLLQNKNRAVIGDEVIQFQTATLLGMIGAQFHYRLSGIVRARYSGAALMWPAGTRFVLIDESIIFAQAQKWMLGTELTYKPVSFGTLEDAAVPTDYEFDEAVNQTEWPVDAVESVRDGSDNVTVAWIPRARLGFDTNPYHSKYYIGSRVKFSNGITIDTAPGVNTATYSSAPPGITVQVCSLNEITSEGPYSDSIAT